MNCKSPREDGIQGEIMKILNEDLIMSVHRYITHIFEKEVLLENWNVAVIYKIYKKRRSINQ